MAKDQNFSCKTCLRVVGKLCVDHDHKTGKVRGLLCDSCNITIGRIDENIDTLLRMIEYLKG